LIQDEMTSNSSRRSVISPVFHESNPFATLVSHRTPTRPTHTTQHHSPAHSTHSSASISPRRRSNTGHALRRTDIIDASVLTARYVTQPPAVGFEDDFTSLSSLSIVSMDERDSLTISPPTIQNDDLDETPRLMIQNVDDSHLTVQHGDASTPKPSPPREVESTPTTLASKLADVSDLDDDEFEQLRPRGSFTRFAPGLQNSIPTIPEDQPIDELSLSTSSSNQAFAVSDPAIV
jgi:hypothetical protein